MVRAWIYNENDPADQFHPHIASPPEFVTLKQLVDIGVNYWYFPTTVEQARDNPNAGGLGEVRQVRGYKNHDIITVAAGKLPNYEEKMKMFFSEHLHEDEEIRYCLEGSGYFDVRRELDNKWIRVEVTSGDMIVLPAGMYHRYTNDTNQFITVMRLFKDNPVWEAINRGDRADGTSSRKQYLNSVTSPANGTATEGQALKPVLGVNGEGFVLKNGAKSIANYPHMRAFNGLLYVSGISSRRADNTHEGVTKHEDGTVTLDIAAQTRAVLSNIQHILSHAGADLGHCIDLTTFLVDMKDYAEYNRVYNEFFPSAAFAPSRTTVAVHQLPHPHLAIEIKCVAVDPRAQ